MKTRRDDETIDWLEDFLSAIFPSTEVVAMFVIKTLLTIISMRILHARSGMLVTLERRADIKIQTVQIVRNMRQVNTFIGSCRCVDADKLDWLS